MAITVKLHIRNTDIYWCCGLTPTARTMQVLAHFPQLGWWRELEE